jgi:hypothetical protein
VNVTGFRIFGVGMVAGLLSGCSLVDALHTAQAYDRLNAAGVIDGPAATTDAVALRTGQATYTGLGTVTASDGTAATAYLGDATFTVDFDTDRISGKIAMYRGKAGLDPTTDPEAFFNEVEADPEGFLLSMSEASGTVTLSNGSISGAGFTADASSGNLTTAGTTTVVSGGSVTGEFTGATANGLRSTDSTVTGTVNGAEASGLEIYFAAAE